MSRYGSGTAGRRTSLEVELDVRIFLLLGTVVVRATLDTGCLSDTATSSGEGIDSRLHLDVAQLELCLRVLV